MNLQANIGTGFTAIGTAEAEELGFFFLSWVFVCVMEPQSMKYLCRRSVYGRDQVLLTS